MTLPLSKTLDSADYLDLAPELVLVDRHFHAVRPQHNARRWEYALALRALATWELSAPTGRLQSKRLADVGGAGSPFTHMANTRNWNTTIIDGAAPSGMEYGRFASVELEEYMETAGRLKDAVVCLSVLEHVEDLNQFCYHLACLVAPGGLLFLTMDCWDKEGPDTAHFHWMRKRIFNPLVRADLADTFCRRDFSRLGETDWDYHGDQLYGSYSFASLALVKRA
jgi:SAM-dependent methyltransferase